MFWHVRRPVTAAERIGCYFILVRPQSAAIPGVIAMSRRVNHLITIAMSASEKMKLKRTLGWVLLGVGLLEWAFLAYGNLL